MISDEEDAADPGTRRKRPAGLCRMPCRTAGGGDLNIATEYVHAAHVVHVDFVDQKHEPEVPKDFMVVYDIVAAYGRRVAPERRRTRVKTRESQAERDDDSGDDDLETEAASPLEARIDFMRFLANMTRRRHALEAALEASEAALVAGMTEELEALVDTLEPLPTGGNDQAARLLQVLIESRSAKTIYPPVDDGEEREKVDATLLEPPLKWGDGDDEPEYKTLEEALRSVDAVLAEVSAEVLAQDEEEQARSRRRPRDDDEPEALDELLAQVCARHGVADDDLADVGAVLRDVRVKHGVPGDDLALPPQYGLCAMKPISDAHNAVSFAAPEWNGSTLVRSTTQTPTKALEMLAPSSLLLCTERSFRFFQETSTASWHCAGSQRQVFRNSAVPVRRAEPSGANLRLLIPVASTHSSTCSNVSRSHSFTARSAEPGHNSVRIRAPN